MTPLLRPRPSEERAVLQSVVYAALFDYPLTVTQLRESLIGEVADESTLLRWFNSSAYLQRTVEYVDGYFFPRGRRDLLLTRARREVTSRSLLTELQGPLRIITHMPFVRMVALSGSLAHLNAEPDADLDLFVITSPHRVWTTTVLTLAIARLLGWRRRLCLNYVVSERALWIAPADLFSANQIVHLQPLIGEATYLKFLDANRFVERFYPNFTRRSVSAREPRTWLEPLFDYTVGPIVEQVCHVLYRTHLKRRAHTWKSRDQVRLEPECLKLHTQSHRREVMERFERALDDALRRAEADRLSYGLTRAESRRRRVSW
jgi:predicted nucleotidyltransferase